ncbi:short chain dehydrogenase family protein [Bordetella holmesii 70147]|nr:short chain dehydrogenase family protein [Bordetella holmesii 70147]
MLGRDEQALQAARASLAGEGIEAGVVAADITQADAVAVAFEQARAAHGPIQILVNNAGQAVSERFERTSAQLWEQMLQVNLSGTFHCTQAALPDMLQGGGGASSMWPVRRA